MNTYTITEKQDFNSIREGYEVQANSLTAAKRAAKRNQSFHGTVLVIEQSGCEVAKADKNGKWS